MAGPALTTAEDEGRGPTDDEVLWAVGCELWTASEELLVASKSLTSGELGGPNWGRYSLQASREPAPGGFTSHLPTVLGNSGEALQLAADALLDGEWEAAWRNLELASTTCQEFVPAASFEGLIDFVFAHSELAPGAGTPAAAGGSLLRLGDGLDMMAVRVEQNEDLRYPHRERAALVLQNAAGVLRQAAELLEPGTFYWPVDPRPKLDEGELDDEWEGDAYYEDELDPEYGFDSGFEDHWRGEPSELVEDQLEVHTFDASARIRALREELQEASTKGLTARRQLLRRLLRETHPDHNPGREAEVLPVFNYVLRMLRVSEGSRRHH